MTAGLGIPGSAHRVGLADTSTASGPAMLTRPVVRRRLVTHRLLVARKLLVTRKHRAARTRLVTPRHRVTRVVPHVGAVRTADARAKGVVAPAQAAARATHRRVARDSHEWAANARPCMLGGVIRKPPRIWVIALLICQLAASIASPSVHAAMVTPNAPDAAVSMGGDDSSRHCPEHAQREQASGDHGDRDHAAGSHGAGNHGCCDSGGCQCTTPAVSLPASNVSSTVRVSFAMPAVREISILARADLFFRPPIA